MGNNLEESVIMSLSFSSQRMSEIPFAGIRKVFEKAAKIEAGGNEVIHFEIGRPDFDTPSHIKKAAAEALENGFVHYTPNLGIMGLRKAIAQSVENYKSIKYDPSSEIMVVAGGQQAMYLSLQAFLEPDDEILVPDPGYSQFFSCIKLCGGVAVPVPLLENENFSMNFDMAEKLVTSRTRGIIINTPHNPTGSVLDQQQIEELGRFAEKHDLVIFSDEAYDRIVYDKAKVYSPAAIPNLKKRTVIWGSLSKTYSMTGWRIGYLAAPAELIRSAVKIQQNLLLSICSFAQVGAIAALEGSQVCVDDMVSEFASRREVILNGIKESPGLSCTNTPLGAFYVFVKHDTPLMNSESLAEYLLDRFHVAMVPGSSFGKNGEGFLRLSYSASLEQCQKGMELIIKGMTEIEKNR